MTSGAEPLANGLAKPEVCPIYCVHSLSVALEEKYPAPGFIHFGEGKVRLYWIRDIARQKLFKRAHSYIYNSYE